MGVDCEDVGEAVEPSGRGAAGPHCFRQRLSSCCLSEYFSHVCVSACLLYSAFCSYLPLQGSWLLFSPVTLGCRDLRMALWQANNLTFHAQLYRLESQLQIPTIVTLLGSVRVRQDQFSCSWCQGYFLGS